MKDQKQLLTISTITNAVIVDFVGTIKYNGTFSYQLGKKEDIEQFFYKLIRALELENSVNVEVR